jgi:hypothetical protein
MNRNSNYLDNHFDRLTSISSISNFSKLDRRQVLKLGSLVLGAGVLSACNANNSVTPSDSSDPDNTASTSSNNQKLDKIALGLGWKAEAEYGGYYQAVATGIYKEYGLRSRRAGNATPGKPDSDVDGWGNRFQLRQCG